MEEKEIKDAEVSEEENNVRMPRRSDFLAVIILLAGLLVGSIFVDVAQLVSGQGFSQKALRNADVFEVDGKTWVAYKDPAIHVKVLTDDSCEKCNPDETLLLLRQYVPTMITEKVDASSDAGKELARQLQIKTIPTFAFEAETLEKTDFYTQAQQVLDKKDTVYVLNTQAMGVPVGKYLEFPEVGEDAIVLGNKEAKVRVIEYSDFQCPYCKMMLPVVQQVLKEYGDRIAFVFKHLPLSFHPQAENAALASECAHEQGKFKEYHDKLFTEQEKWGKTQGTASFKQYAVQLRLNSQQFNTCLDSKKYAEKVANDAKQAQEFGITGTPGIFIGEEFVGGAAQYETVKEILDRQLEDAPQEEVKQEETKSTEEENKA
jgi:protein-disulfide isomerase